MFGRDVAYEKLFGKETNTSNANEKSPNITLFSTMKKEKRLTIIQLADYQEKRSIVSRVKSQYKITAVIRGSNLYHP